jgi:signal transduction histidine kinase
MRAYFNDCVEDHRYEFDREGVELELVDQLQDPVMIRIDAERFKRVMQNILNNALKHASREQGLVQLVLRETRTSAIIEVRDNGPGIPEEHLPHIFERFYRADVSRSNVDGSGLGLAIARQIVEAHDGRIWATSTVGEGTRMMISLRKY